MSNAVEPSEMTAFRPPWNNGNYLSVSLVRPRNRSGVRVGFFATNRTAERTRLFFSTVSRRVLFLLFLHRPGSCRVLIGLSTHTPSRDVGVAKLVVSVFLSLFF